MLNRGEIGAFEMAFKGKIDPFFGFDCSDVAYLRPIYYIC